MRARALGFPLAGGLALAWALAACEPAPAPALAPDAFAGDFEPIGEPLVDLSFADLSAADLSLGEPDVSPPDPGPGARGLVFEAIPHDAEALLRATDLAFLPTPEGAPPELLIIDKDGSLAWLELGSERARLRGMIPIEGTFHDSDAGLVSLALAPDFATSGDLYVGLCLDAETNVIRRYRFDRENFAGVADTAVEIMRLEAPGSPRPWHNLGSLGFTESGAMWALMGDKVLDEQALDWHSPLGALLLFAPDPSPEGGWLPHPDHPGAGGEGHPAVFAKGLRSPWKGAYHAGRWFIGDVGLDTWEELNLVDGFGQTLGWPEVEGPCPEAGTCGDHRDPLLAFGRGEGAFVRDDPERTSARLRSIWLGPVYQPHPADPYGGLLDGRLLFGDFYSGFVREIAAEDPSGESTHLGHLAMPTAMAQGPDGYLYAITLGTWPPDAPTAKTGLYRVLRAP